MVGIGNTDAMSDGRPLSRLDLNLLVALDALLSERSVTRAAERLHLSQPSLSASLARLRTYFGDALLERRGNAYKLSALGQQLAPKTSVAIDAARRVFETRTDWVPETSSREFQIYGSDHAFATIGSAVSLLAADRAPSIRFRFLLHNEAIVNDAAERLRDVDGLVMPHGFVDGAAYTDLWHEGWVVVAAEGSGYGSTLRLEDLSTAKWVITYQSRGAYTAATRQLQQLGVEPDVAAVVESFLAMPAFIAGTERLGLLQSGLVPLIRRFEGVRVLMPPFEVIPILNALWWDPTRESDPEHRWLRGIFAEAAEALQLSDVLARPGGDQRHRDS